MIIFSPSLPHLDSPCFPLSFFSFFFLSLCFYLENFIITMDLLSTNLNLKIYILFLIVMDPDY